MQVKDMKVGMKVRFKDIEELREMWRGQELEVLKLNLRGRCMFKHLTVPPESYSNVKVGETCYLLPSHVEMADPDNNEEALTLLEEED